MNHQVDVAIIGAGTAGLSARREVAKVTDSYLVIDPGPIGTTCARVGCMPSKVFIQAANDFNRRSHFETLGISGQEHLKVDTRKIMGHVRSLRDRFVRSITDDMESWQATKLLRKRARFTGPNTLDVEGDTIEAKQIIIATGSRPLVPPAWASKSKHLITTDDFFELKELPQKIAVIGLGVIGLELGQALHRLGVDVTAFGARPTVGGLTDPELLKYAGDTFSKEMKIVFENVDITGEDSSGIHIKAGNNGYVFDKALIAIGRKPNLDGLGLKEIGVPLTERGVPVFNPSTYQIEGFPIYLVGDVNAERPILHEAADEGRIAGFNSTREEPQCFLRRTRLGVVFCDPNIAGVGETHAELIRKEASFVTGKVSYEGQGRAIVMLKEKGLVHIYAHSKTGQILGAEMIAPGGEHLAHLLAWAISLKLNVFEALSLPFYHPVLEEGLRTALREAAGKIHTQAPTLEVLRCQDTPLR